MVALAGAGPWPQITSVRPRFTSWTMTGTSPPGPLRCGSTTCSVNAVATAASKALPPFSSVAMPTAVAIQWVDVTTPKVPSISGRVVNGLGLIFETPARMRLEPRGKARHDDDDGDLHDPLHRHDAHVSFHPAPDFLAVWLRLLNLEVKTQIGRQQ